jgi:hypothetical protein
MCYNTSTATNKVIKMSKLTDEQLKDLATIHFAPQIDAAGQYLDLMPLLRAVEAAVESGRTLVDSGALKMAINVLRRAGKDEVADALESTSFRCG